MENTHKKIRKGNQWYKLFSTVTISWHVPVPHSQEFKGTLLCFGNRNYQWKNKCTGQPIKNNQHIQCEFSNFALKKDGVKIVFISKAYLRENLFSVFFFFKNIYQNQRQLCASVKLSMLLSAYLNKVFKAFSIFCRPKHDCSTNEEGKAKNVSLRPRNQLPAGLEGTEFPN